MQCKAFSYFASHAIEIQIDANKFHKYKSLRCSLMNGWLERQSDSSFQHLVGGGRMRFQTFKWRRTNESISWTFIPLKSNGNKVNSTCKSFKILNPVLMTRSGMKGVLGCHMIIVKLAPGTLQYSYIVRRETPHGELIWMMITLCH